MARKNGPTRKGFGLKGPRKPLKVEKPLTARQLAIVNRKIEWHLFKADGWKAWSEASPEAKTEAVLWAAQAGIPAMLYSRGRLARAFDQGPEAFVAECNAALARSRSGRVLAAEGRGEADRIAPELVRRGFPQLVNRRLKGIDIECRGI